MILETGTGKYDALLERCTSLEPVPTAVAHPCDTSADLFVEAMVGLDLKPRRAPVPLTYPRADRPAPNLQEIVGQADQGPLAGDFLQATQQKLADATHALDLAEDRLDDVLARRV